MADTSTSLEDLIEWFQREVSIPGNFTTDYPTIGDDDVVNLLCDAFAAAQLDGWFSTGVLDTLAETVTPSLSTAGRSLVVLYAGMRLIRTQIRNLPQSTRYKAGSVEYDVAISSNLLTSLLKEMQTRRNELVQLARSGARVTYVSDNYAGRLYQMPPGRFLVWEIPLVPALAYGY